MILDRLLTKHFVRFNPLASIGGMNFKVAQVPILLLLVYWIGFYFLVFKKGRNLLEEEPSDLTTKLGSHQSTQNYYQNQN